ncbi:MAG TPA: response regulator, partial [Steroidobacter sp.]|nr:response regulator [Steroidobacter sp.]
MTSARVLIVEDEGLVAEEIALRLEQMGHIALGVADTAEEAFIFVRNVRPDMALIDINIKGSLNGIEIARRFRAEYDVPVIFMTAHADAATLREATATEPFGYIVKPFDARTLAATLETALRRRRAEEKLAKMERWLAATMTSIGDGVIATDREFRVSFINPVAERLCGWPNGSALGKPVREVFRIEGSAFKDLAEIIGEATTDRVAISLDECELESADGVRLPIDDTLAPIRDTSGRINGVVIVFRDASERKRHEAQLRQLNEDLEDRVQRRTAQLQAANHELASFAYSIAHDLRAPLRAINGFATRVVQEHAGELDAEGRRLLEVVTSRAAQMSRMIDDYLRLSRLSHVDLNYQTLDMTLLAREAWVIATQSVEKPPELQLGELPNARGDENLMRQVWTNLLSNAVKFTRT